MPDLSRVWVRGDCRFVYPGFSDAKTIEHFRSIENLESPDRSQKTYEAREAAEQLGIFLAVQAVPGGNGDLLDVLAGSPVAMAARVEASAPRGMAAYDRAEP